MTSGDTLQQFFPADNEPPTSVGGVGYATLTAVNSLAPVNALAFDGVSTAEAAMFTGLCPRNYASGGFTVQFVWAPVSSAPGAAVWGMAFDRMNANFNVSASASYATTILATVSGTVGNTFVYSTIAFTDGAQIDSIAKGEMFRLQVVRVPGDTGDTYVGDCNLYSIEIKET